ncbi:carbohydrate porin [Alteromonas halophila]|uniref:Porin n=1 Tax=Alteromonas halophila TaxID=516698 RepID=A0A918JPA6_9ALTE|nr:carbohydrate porin [Alteromonas halophila]GGW89969.1 hypothetical protein GCM10007391_25390 [Alteromonas halophila]
MQKQLAVTALLLPFAVQATDKPPSYSAFVTTDGSKPFTTEKTPEASLRSYAGVALRYSLSDNWQAYGSVHTLQGDNGAEITQDIQVYSNIDAGAFTGIYDAWLEGSFHDGAARIKLGQFDANSEFAVPEYASDFIHSSMGFSPTITFLPTYPSPTIGASAHAAMGEVSVSLGLFSDEDNRFEQVFSIGELTWDTSLAAITLGAWQFDGDVQQEATGLSDTQTFGTYLVAEGALPVSGSILSAPRWFAQVGWAEHQFNPVRLHLGAGISTTSLMHNPNHSAGLAITHVEVAADYYPGQASVADSETTIELFYQYQLSEQVAIKPDVQLIFSPAFAPGHDRTLVATLRLDIQI